MNVDFESSLIYILTQLTNAYRIQLERTMCKIGLHSGQIFILISLWKIDGQSQVDLVKDLNLSAPTINKMVKSLTVNGFVKCQKCPTDGRIMRVFLTDKGKQCQNIVAEEWVNFESISFSPLTDTEKLILFQLFGKLKTSLKQGFAIES